MNTRGDGFLGSGILHVFEWLLHLTPKDMRFTTFLLRDTLVNVKTYEEAKVWTMVNKTCQ